MPYHPVIAQRLHLLEGITSIEQAHLDPELRARWNGFNSYPDAPTPPDVQIRERSIPGPHGPVRVRIYLPPEEKPNRHGLVWVHGGAFKFGDLDMGEADWTARELAERASAVVVSVDYRLAVDGVTYPVPLDDVVAVLRWARDHMDEPDIASWSVGGASAGANLAAGAALRLRDEDDWVPEHLVLVYPMMHPQLPPPSASLALALPQMPSALRLSTDGVRAMSENYLGGPPTSAPGYAMPALSVLDGLGPTLVLNAEYDELRASGEAFSASLAAVGVDVEQILVRGMLHGFLNLPRSLTPVDEALNAIAQRLRPTPVEHRATVG